MKNYQLTHLADHVLIRELHASAGRLRADTATLLAHLAEVDHRKLYLPAAYASMFAWCVGELHMSEDSAAKRIQAARAAREFPALFDAIADGRLHLSAVGMLTPHLTVENVNGLIAAAAHRTKAEIALLLAERFPRPDVPAFVQPLPMAVSDEHAPGHVGAVLEPELVMTMSSEHAPGHVGVRTHVAALSAERFVIQFTVSRETREKLQAVQALLSHAVPSGDVAELFDRCLEAALEKYGKRRYATSDRPRSSRGTSSGRHIPAAVRRAVAQRDGEQCTFVSESGKRCEERRFLQFDHIEPFAEGGATTATNLRLRCRAHNQYAAEQVYGKAFMDGKREQSERRAAEARRAKAAAEARAKQRAERDAVAAEKARAKELAAREEAAAREVMPWLRALGFNAAQARHGAEACAHLMDASLEDRVKCAAGALAPRCLHIPAPSAAGVPASEGTRGAIGVAST